MSKSFSSHKKLVLTITALVCFLAAGALLCFLFLYRKDQTSDYKRIRSELYDTVFLSMFPIDNYDEDSYEYYRGQYTLKTSYCIPDIGTLRTYLKKIAASGNEISTVYLGVRPEKLAAGELLSLLREYPSVSYHIILPYASMDYWRQLTEEEVNRQLSLYRELADTLLAESNVSLYLFSWEWLICNPANYSDDFLVTEDISLTLMLHCDRDHKYLLTPENAEDTFHNFAQLLEQERNIPISYPSLSGYTVVFFGDSVIGNYTDSSSIPGVVFGLTGAATYNCGYGGSAAAVNPADPGGSIGLPDIIDAFVRKDLSFFPRDEQIYLGMEAYLKDGAQEPQYFVINYGLNDYFSQYPVKDEDPYDVTTYEGALRKAVCSLRDAYPEARILLTIPNFTSYSADDDERAEGNRFTDYVDAVLTVGADCDVTVLNNYADLGINIENHGDYLLDGVHPNEALRFTIGSRIAQQLH